MVEGSVCDVELVDECMEWADACFHLASAVGVKLIVDSARSTRWAAACAAPQVVTEGAHRLGRRLLFASTSEIYGKNGSAGLTEHSDRVLGPPSIARWSYSTAKAFGEALVLGYHREREARHGRRPPLQHRRAPADRRLRDGAAALRRARPSQGEDLTVYGDGSQSRCFSHVYDTTRALVMLMDEEGAPRHGLQRRRARARSRSSKLAEAVIERTGSSSGIRMVPYEEAYGEGFEELGRRAPTPRRSSR